MILRKEKLLTVKEIIYMFSAMNILENTAFKHI
jgi:hypothetical protein